MTRRPALTLAELLVTGVVFSLLTGALVNALFAVPQWARRIGDRSDLVREVRIARLALRRDLAVATSVQWQAGALLLETATTEPVRYVPRRSAGGAVVGLERIDPAGTRTLIASYLADLTAVEEPAGSFWIQLQFRHGTEWRRLVIMTCPAGGGA